VFIKKVINDRINIIGEFIMKLSQFSKIILLCLISPVGYICSLLCSGYFFGDSVFIPDVFVFVIPFPVSIYAAFKFGKTKLKKILIISFCFLLATIFFFVRPLPDKIYMKSFEYRCLRKYDYNELEDFRKHIESKYNEGTLALKGNEHRFWGGLENYIAESEKNDYILNNFVEIGLKIENQNIDKIYFFINNELWALVYKRNYPLPPLVINRRNWEFENRKNRKLSSGEIFENYYGFKR
jgi:hypothetical protein